MAAPHAVDASRPTIAFLGGTGDQGRGLALRLGLAGHPVVVGSRSPSRAQAAAEELASLAPGLSVAGMSNDDAAEAGEVVVVAVPYDGHAALLAGLAGRLAGKLVVDCVNPLGFDARGPYPLEVAEGSAAEQAASLLPDSIVVAAFHHLSAVLLLDRAVTEINTDVLVCGEDRAAVNRVIDLAGTIPGMRGIYAGRLRLSRQLEALTANLIAINRRYKAHAGVRITDV